DVGAFAVTGYTAAGVVELNNPVAQELVTGRDFVQIVPRGATPAPPPDFRLTVRAKAFGDWGGNEVADNGITAGNGVRARVRPIVAAALRILASPTVGGNPASTAVTVDAPAGATAIQVANANGFAANDRVLIDGGEYTINAITNPGTFDIVPPAPALLPAGTPITEGGNPRGNVANPVPIGGATVDSTDLTNLVNGANIDIGGTAFTIANVTPTGPVITLNNPVPAGDTWTAGTTIRRMRGVIDPANPNIINVQNASQLYAGAIVELDTGTAKEEFTVDSVSGDAVTLSGNPAGNYFEDYRVRLIEGEVSAQYRRNHIVVDEEIFSNLRFVDDGGPNYIVRHINTESDLIDLMAGADFSGSVSQIAELPIIPAPAVGPVRFWGDLTGGRDNLNGLTVDDFVGVEGGSEGSTGIQSLEYIDEVSICLAPGMWSSTIQSSLITHCETLKDRFAILDPPDDLEIEGIREFREPIDTKYAALYYPWLTLRDPLLKRDVNLAPSGHMAGLYARVDNERGVHKAPANEVVRGIRFKNGFVRDVSKREQDLLNPRNINALRAFPGRGQRVWGARTLSSDASWKYINVRRLFIYVEESIDEGTQWVVFEPNDEPLWARVRATISNFLLTVWRSGALEGTKPEEAFFVKCDLTTMTQADIDNGRLICVIGIAPVKPAEFVIFRIQQKTREATGV
ncbi:MAG: phage tail sheath subtilisin-like domain-containing protein, partial [Deltaproteobacteria bacterium]|nr:phage tail sheath subtilisin-like domain-containing protein [Deltaproteobacteria bacterium]